MQEVISQYRCGEFELDISLMDKAPGAIVEALKGMLIVRCECFIHNFKLHYTAFSEHFDPVVRGVPAPKYKANINQIGPNKYIVNFTREQGETNALSNGNTILS